MLAQRDDIASISLSLRAHALSTAEQFHELIGLGSLVGVDSHTYQVETVRKVLRVLRGRALLADEVGLGKTVEALMILREYQLGGMAPRILSASSHRPPRAPGPCRWSSARHYSNASSTARRGPGPPRPSSIGSQPRPAQARALAERFAVRNGVQALIDITAGRAVYSSIWMGWTAESDDRHEGLLRMVLSERDGGEPDSAFTQTLSPHLSHRLIPIDLEPVDPVRATAVAKCVGARTRRAVTAAVAPIVESADRRRRRDHERMTTYFTDLAREARAQGKRRSVDDASLAEKLRHFAAERDAKLAELGARFAVRVTSTPFALLRVEVPVLFVRVRVRRRKEEREIVLCLPAGASSLDRPSCDGCACSSSAVAMCDDRLHVLCTDCAPLAQGRIPCPRCRQER